MAVAKIRASKTARSDKPLPPAKVQKPETAKMKRDRKKAERDSIKRQKAVMKEIQTHGATPKLLRKLERAARIRKTGRAKGG